MINERITETTKKKPLCSKNNKTLSKYHFFLLLLKSCNFISISNQKNLTFFNLETYGENHSNVILEKNEEDFSGHGLRFVSFFFPSCISSSFSV